MDFVTAEEKFQELQARIRRGEPMSEDQYQEELAKLMVQDDSGVFWSLDRGRDAGSILTARNGCLRPRRGKRKRRPPLPTRRRELEMPTASEPAP